MSKKLCIYWFVSIVIIGLLSACGPTKTVHGSRQRQGKNIPATTPGATYEGKQLTTADQKHLVAEARRWIGTKYVYGGHTKDGTDCSGFVMEVFMKVCGLKLPRTANGMADYSRKINYDKILPGDLVFFATSSQHSNVSHVGMYIGEGKMIHASSSRGVMISDLSGQYYQRTYHSSGRVLASNDKSKKSKKSSAKDAAQNAKPGKETKKDKKPKTVKPKVEQVRTIESLDDILEQKIDSIYSPFFD